MANAKNLFESFCAGIRVDPGSVSAELSPARDGRLHVIKSPQPWEHWDGEDGEEHIIGAKECGWAKRRGCIAAFDLILREWNQDKDLPYRGDAQTVISAILREHEGVKKPDEPDCHVFVLDGHRIYVLKDPYFSGSTRNVDRVKSLVKKYGHISCKIDRDDVIKMGFKPGISPLSGIIVIHNAKAPELICTNSQVIQAAREVGHAIVARLGLQHVCWQAGAVDVCWFSGWPRPKKADYAKFVVEGVKVCKELGIKVNGVTKYLATLPHKTLLKDKDPNLRAFGKLVVSCKRAR